MPKTLNSFYTEICGTNMYMTIVMAMIIKRAGIVF